MRHLKHSFSGGEFLLFRRIALRLYSILERHSAQQKADLVGAANFVPGLFRFFNQLESQPKERRTRHAITRACGAMAHRREGRFDRIGRAQMLPVLGRKIVKRSQAVAVFLQLLYSLGILGLVL